MKIKDLAAKNIDELTFSVVDVETTGMYAEFNRVVDVGIVKMRGGKIVEEWETLVNPKQSIPIFITEITKITNKQVRGKPEFSSFATDLHKKLQDTIFVAHNVYFDFWFLWFEMRRAGLSLDLPKICTVMLGRKLTPDLMSANLDHLAERYGIEIRGRHRALPDARAAAEILIKLIEIAREKYKVRTFFDLHRLQWMRIEDTGGKSSLFSDF